MMLATGMQEAARTIGSAIGGAISGAGRLITIGLFRLEKAVRDRGNL